MARIALEYAAGGMLVVESGVVSVYMVEVGVLRCWLSLWACCWCPCRRALEACGCCWSEWWQGSG